MNAIAKILSAALLASLVASVQPASSLACDGDPQAKEQKKKNDDTVAQRDRSQDQNKKKAAQAPGDKREREGTADSSNTTRTN